MTKRKGICIQKMELLKKKKKRIIISILVTIIMIVIISLLLQRFLTIFNDNNKQVPTGNIDIFELKCNDNCSCSKNNKTNENNKSNKSNENNKSNQMISKLNNDSSLTNIIISNGVLTFNKNIKNYSVLLENNVDKFSIRATKNNNKSTIYYIYNNKLYSVFNNVPISVGQNTITIAVIAENGTFNSYRVVVTRLNKKGETIKPVVKDTDNSLTDITISNGELLFEKNTKNYTVLVGGNVDKISLTAIKKSKKATVSYIYNGQKYNEFKDVEISEGDNIVNILVTAEDGTTASYLITITKKTQNLSQIDGLQWFSTNKLNVFSNPVYKGEAIISPGSTNSYEFIIRNKVNQKVNYQFEFEEDNEYAINMKYRLKKNGKYLAGDENTWVSYDKLNISEMEIDDNTDDDYILDWKWFDGANDNAISKLQNDYTLSITLSAAIEE